MVGDELGLIQSAAITEQLANSVPDNGGVYFVPALTGLGAPYWTSMPVVPLSESRAERVPPI